MSMTLLTREIVSDFATLNKRLFSADMHCICFKYNCMINICTIALNLCAKGLRFNPCSGIVLSVYYQMLQMQHLLTAAFSTLTIAVVNQAVLITLFFIWSINVLAVLQCSASTV